MAQFSEASLKKLREVHIDLQTIFLFTVKYFDCSIIYGLRTTEEQQELYAQGRTKPGYIVTYKDGIHKKSKHQDGLAVDVIVYHKEHPHIRWKDERGMYHFAGIVLAFAKILREQGKINSEIRWGGNWDMDDDLYDQTFMDLVHFEII